MAAKDIFIAIGREDPDEMRIVLEDSLEGLNDDNDDGVPPLRAALGSERACLPVVEVLLEFGADPNEEDYLSAAIHRGDRALSELLERYGADPSLLTAEEKRLLLGFEDVREPSKGISKASYLASRHRRFGDQNPTDLTDPYKVVMVRCGWSAYGAAIYFDDIEGRYEKGAPDISSDTVWCNDRYGQSFTRLPDLRVILIGGEHEDFYDPDFCIYNDVIVVSPEGEITIWGYPADVFPPTDFHTATLVGETIYIVGCLGYMSQRADRIPVYRLDTSTFRIEVCQTSGDDPGWVYKHGAKLLEGRTIQIWGDRDDGPDKGGLRRLAYDLNLETMQWRRVHPT